MNITSEFSKFKDNIGMESLGEVGPDFEPYRRQKVDLPEGLVDIVLESNNEQGEINTHNIELWASLPPEMRSLIDGMAFKVAPYDLDLRGKVTNTYLDMLRTLDEAELISYLESTFNSVS